MNWLLSPAADGLISYSTPEGQLMMPPGYPIASLNDSTYDGVHERRRVAYDEKTNNKTSAVWLHSSHPDHTNDASFLSYCIFSPS